MSRLEEIWTDPAVQPPTDSAMCPASEDLAALANGSLPLAERERLVDHLVECASCSAALRALQALGSWALAAEEGLETIRPVESDRSGGRVAPGWVAAAAVLAAAAGWLIGSGSGPTGGKAADEIAANPAIVDLLADGALRAAAPLERQRLELSASGGVPVVLVLHLERPEAGALYTAEFLYGGETAARLEGLASGPFGTLTILLRGAALAAGDYELVVRRAPPGAADEAARYRIQIAHPS